MRKNTRYLYIEIRSRKLLSHQKSLTLKGVVQNFEPPVLG